MPGNGTAAAVGLDEAHQVADGGGLSRAVGAKEAEPVLAHKAVHQVVEVNAPVDELALHGETLTVLHIVAQHVADLGDACQNTGAVSVAQTPLHIPLFIVSRINTVMLLKLSA